MPLTPNTKLGDYEILAAIGAGGMGEVYRARDNKLGREVAIKVLPEEFTQHPQKLARFEREARLLAALNHPGIATLYEVEESEGKPFLVMELVEGETLQERIAGGPLPVKEAVTLAQQIAEALDAAHEKGVIHRDLKPANIKVDPEGQVKVLDFGLAKAFADEVPESELSASPTLSRDATKAGVILGTAAYMSPEQAKGKTVDKRTDIFSFGMVLYEMLTGKRAFSGEDVSDVLASIMKLEPDWKAVPHDLDPRIENLLRRCLRKDRKKRLRDIGDAGSEIEEVLAAPRVPVASETVKARAPMLSWAVAGLFAVAFLATLWILWPTESPLVSSVRLSMNLGAGDHQLAPYIAQQGSMVVLSPDGKTLVFVGRTPDGNGRQIYLRSLDSLEATPLSSTENASSPFFSPNGQWLAFFTAGALKKVSLSGGAALTIAEVPIGFGGTWGPDDTIVYGQATSGLYRVPASGGTAVELTTLGEGEGTHRWPWFLPNGNAVLFVVGTPGERMEDGTIEAVLLETGERKVLNRGGTYPRYASSGHLLYAREATLFAMPFDADRIEPTGEPRPVIEDVLTYGGSLSGASYYAFSGDGSLVYVSGEASFEEIPRELVRVDREGNASLITETLGDWETPRFSPDGQRLAVRKGDPDQEVWILELSRGTLQRLTFELGFRPLWSPDGQTVFFTSANTNIYSKPADGSGPAQQLTTGSTFRVPGAITSDGRSLILRQGGDAGSPNLDIGILHLEEEGEPEMLLETSFYEHTPKLSPDDRWLAFVSNESGRDEIFVTRFPPSGKWQISTEGGREPMWSRDSRELFYRNGEKMMAVDVSAGAESAGKPTLLFEGSYDLKIGSGASNYDVTPDGQGFVMIRTPEGTAESWGATQINLVLNWFEELKQLAPTN